MKPLEKITRDAKTLMALHDEYDSRGKLLKQNVFLHGNPLREFEIRNLRIPENIVNPKNSDRKTIRVKIVVPANIYQPLGNGRYIFYGGQLYLEPGLRQRINRRLCEIPRYSRYDNGRDIWVWVCLKMDSIAGENETVESVLTNLQRFLSNPY